MKVLMTRKVMTLANSGLRASLDVFCGMFETGTNDDDDVDIVVVFAGEEDSPASRAAADILTLGSRPLEGGR